MNDNRSFQSLAAICAIISGPLAIISIVLGLKAVDFNFEVFSDMTLLLKTGESGATFWRWSMILDIFGYYLLLTPIAFLLWHWLKEKDTVRLGFYTFCGLAYMVIGAIGASIFAAVSPSMIVDYVSSSGQQREVLEIVFQNTTNIVYGGLWGYLELIPGGVWWLGIGFILRTKRPVLGMATIILGLASLLNVIGTILDIEAIAMPTLMIYLYFAPIWALWLGIDILRSPAVNE